ncbi:uncharacterized protein ACLA_035230 [Aspergillus clavatus NRRL 1]|uniref:Uncharacterized protein n=1 Tax=Aspergillus clavatus (strain ATCC 1007 / CBS 513.65 / DSM 816 / NCTC 3887 / NRRL 1 / QM 1276 / 107) TaxID=344612 RepID=A1CJJ6_ASPCL|nr:uncharacterized protein ACLA_035230 [Aspergillus clavatus NRRL 1]EAW09320.1 hypothetical protein ACLA_035230 [Aspergillus clavatus NRRL 1]
MHLLTLFLLLLGTVAAIQAPTRDALKPRNWDLRLLGPGCDPNDSNIDISLFHRSGFVGASCEAVDTGEFNTTSVKSISWKSPGEDRYDLCIYGNAGCRGAAADVLRSGWEVCYPFSGWKGWKVVAADVAC